MGRDDHLAAGGAMRRQVWISTGRPELWVYGPSPSDPLALRPKLSGYVEKYHAVRTRAESYSGTVRGGDGLCEAAEFSTLEEAKAWVEATARLLEEP